MVNVRRKEEKNKNCILMYKIANGLVKIDATDRLIKPSRLSRNIDQYCFQIPSCNTEMRKESYSTQEPSGIGMLSPLTLLLLRVLKPSRLCYLIKLIKLFFTCTVILFVKIKLRILRATKVTKWQNHQWLMEFTELVEVEASSLFRTAPPLPTLWNVPMCLYMIHHFVCRSTRVSFF